MYYVKFFGALTKEKRKEKKIRIVFFCDSSLGHCTWESFTKHSSAVFWYNCSRGSPFYKINCLLNQEPNLQIPLNIFINYYFFNTNMFMKFSLQILTLRLSQTASLNFGIALLVPIILKIDAKVLNLINL